MGLVVKLRPTLETPWTVARQAPLPMVFPRQEYWSGLSCLSLGDLPDPRIEPESPALQAVSGIAGRFFTIDPHSTSCAQMTGTVLSNSYFVQRKIVRVPHRDITQIAAREDEPLGFTFQR